MSASYKKLMRNIHTRMDSELQGLHNEMACVTDDVSNVRDMLLVLRELVDKLEARVTALEKHMEVDPKLWAEVTAMFDKWAKTEEEKKKD